MIYLGAPQWSNDNWRGVVYTERCPKQQMLSQYGSVFNSVEGNTTFYATPSEQTLLQWQRAVPNEFRFTFKLPKRISHELGLLNVEAELEAWLALFNPLRSQIGSVLLQLPARFGPSQLPLLAAFLSLWPVTWPLAVEVRHLAFFDKAQHEQALNRLLVTHQVERVMMDTRALFSETEHTTLNIDALIDAHRKKPQLPVHAVALTQRPLVRFVGHSQLLNNDAFLAPWLNKVQQWLNEGRTPYLFFHTADNQHAAQLARHFCRQLGVGHSVLAAFPAEREPQTATCSFAAKPEQQFSLF